MKFQYDDLLRKLNSIILGQYLIKSNMTISAEDIRTIQGSDPHLRDIRSKLRQDYETRKVDGHFVLLLDLVFRQDLVLDQPLLRLCLPPLVCENILRTLHDSCKAHISTQNLISQYNNNFYTRGIDSISRKVVEGCLHCSLNVRRRKLLVKGTRRQYERNMVPGEIWSCDLIYLPRSNSGHNFVLTLTERLSSYLAGIALKSLNGHHVAEAFRIFLGIMPQCRVIYTDHGRADFGSIFTL